MKIAVLTTREPLYLPAFFMRFLKAKAKDVAGVFCCPPIYRGQTSWTMLRRYLHTFGLSNGFRLALRIIYVRVRDILHVDQISSVEAVAKSYGVLVEACDNVNDAKFLDRLHEMGVDCVLSVSCPQIFNEDLINLPSLGCLNLHGALLPNYKGIMPSFWMMAKGELTAGVTIFFVNVGIDTGEVAAQRSFSIKSNDTLHSLIVRSKRIACDLAIETLDKIEQGTVKRTQIEGEGSYFGWPTREAYKKFRVRGRSLW